MTENGHMTEAAILNCKDCCCGRFLETQIATLGEVEQLKTHHGHFHGWQDQQDNTIRQIQHKFEKALAAIKDLTMRVRVLEAVEPVEPAEVEPQESYLEKRVREIEARGNLRFDLLTGRMTVLRDISFVPIKAKEKPVATLSDPKAAAVVLDDIAAVGALFENNLLTIEGHTGGGDNDFWQQLANDRARLVGNEIAQRGHHTDNLKTVGFPGKTGLNKSVVVPKLSMHPEAKAMLADFVRRPSANGSPFGSARSLRAGSDDLPTVVFNGNRSMAESSCASVGSRGVSPSASSRGLLVSADEAATPAIRNRRSTSTSNRGSPALSARSLLADEASDSATRVRPASSRDSPFNSSRGLLTVSDEAAALRSRVSSSGRRSPSLGSRGSAEPSLRSRRITSTKRSPSEGSRGF